jgi:hypothetical protein
MTENASGDNEVDIYHKLAGELSFQMLSDLMDPKTELGAEYAKFKKASEGGNDLARDNCRLLMRRELQRAQALAQYEFLNSPAGKTVSEKILERHQLIEQQKLPPLRIPGKYLPIPSSRSSCERPPRAPNLSARSVREVRITLSPASARPVAATSHL